MRCHAHAQIERKQAMEMFEHDCMQAVGLLTDKDHLERWKKKEVRFNTKTAYTQNKWVGGRVREGQSALCMACVGACGWTRCP